MDPNDFVLLESGEKDLQQCVLSGADLKGKSLINRNFSKAQLASTVFDGANVSGSKFEGSNLHQASFRSSTCLNCQFNGIMRSVDFTESDLRGSTFKGVLGSTNFTGSDLRGVSFKGRFQEHINFEGSVVDNATDFDGVEMPRPLSRMPIFSDYDFVEGRLKRRSNNKDDKPEVADDTPLPLQPTAPAEDNIRRHLASEPEALSVLARSLQVLIADEIERTPTPNQPDRLDRHENYVDFLQNISDGLGVIASELESFQSSGGGILYR